MEQYKRSWRTIGLPDALFKRVKNLIRYTGHTSVSEYVRTAVLKGIQYDESVAEEQREIEKEVRERIQQ